jgi:hypothetical protein
MVMLASARWWQMLSKKWGSKAPSQWLRLEGAGVLLGDLSRRGRSCTLNGVWCKLEPKDGFLWILVIIKMMPQVSAPGEDTGP